MVSPCESVSQVIPAHRYAVGDAVEQSHLHLNHPVMWSAVDGEHMPLGDPLTIHNLLSNNRLILYKRSPFRVA
jgi:hypothetical protein